MAAEPAKTELGFDRPQPLFFGAQGLFGFVYRGAPGRETALVILNGGLLHNVGPFRLHCDLAAAAHATLIPVVRIDQSGKGESPSKPNMGRRDILLSDYDDVYAYLASCGVKRTVLLGLCSGADDSLQIASQRPSVAGMVMLDGFATRNFAYWRTYYAAKAKSLCSPRKVIGRLTGTRKGGMPTAQKPDQIAIRDWDAAADMQEKFSAFHRRGGKTLAVFTGGVIDYYNHLGQLGSTLACPDGLTEEFYSSADHTYRVVEQRCRLVERVVSWIDAEF